MQMVVRTAAASPSWERADMQPGPRELEAPVKSRSVVPAWTFCLSASGAGPKDLHFENHKLDLLKRENQQTYTTMETEKERESMAEVDT